jgi:hypothetical protein
MSRNKHTAPLDMGAQQNRLDLMRRYNEAVGAPGPQVKQVQQEFIDGIMQPEFVITFADQCEMMIAARSTMYTGPHLANAQWPYNGALPEKAG